jgi:DNA-binding response OmpR family regulator
VNRPERRLSATRERSRPDGDPLLYVADDDVATVDLLLDVASEAGWSTMGFLRLAGLRAALDREVPQFLIIDDDLPDGSGGDLARDLRDDARTTDVQLLVCTAAHPRRLAEIGSWAPVVSKPFDLREIEDFLMSAASQGAPEQRRSFDRPG